MAGEQLSPHHQQREAGCVGSEQRAGPVMGQDRCAVDTSRDRATLAGFLATVGAGWSAAAFRTKLG